MSSDISDLPEPAPSRRLTRDLSHDLRTPLTVIRIQAQLLMRITRRGDDLERERLLSGLRRIDEAVTKLNDVLQRLVADENDRRPAAKEVV